MFKTTKITPYTNPSGGTVWRVTGHNGTEEIRRNFPTWLKAQKFLTDVSLATPSQGTTGATSAAVNLNDLDKESLLTLLQGLISAAKPLAPIPPPPVATLALPGPTVEKAIDGFLVAKMAKQLRSRSLADYRCRLARLKPLYNSPVNSVTVDILTPLIFTPGMAPRTINGNRRVVYGLFEWCRRRKFVPFNPVEDMELVRVNHTDPKIFSLDEVRAILLAAKNFKRGVMVPYISLGFFGGFRPQELRRLEWGTHIRPRQGIIQVTADISKTRGKRIIDINETLAAWLKLCDGQKVAGKNFRRHLDAVRRRGGFKASFVRKKDRGLKEWPMDGIRHTALSYRFALTQDENKTAFWAGNSPDVFHRHYKGLVNSEEVKAYWALLPESLGDGE